MAAEVKVLEQECIFLVNLLAVTHFGWLSLFLHDDFEIHNFASLCVPHLLCPNTVVLLNKLFESSLLSFAHLKLEWLLDEVEKANTHPSALGLQLLASLSPLLDRVHFFCVRNSFSLLHRRMRIRLLHLEKVAPKTSATSLA